MPALLYSSTESVRASLGIGDVELPDASITDLGVVEQLLLDLEDVYPDHEALRALVLDSVPAPPTDADRLKYLSLTLYSQYQMAVHVLPAVQLWSAQRLSDGDATQQRFEPSDVQKTIDRVTAQRDKYRAILNPSFLVGGGSYQILTRVAPATDPVIGV